MVLVIYGLKPEVRIVRTTAPKATAIILFINLYFFCTKRNIKKTKVKNPTQNNILNFVLPAKMIAAVINK